MASKPLPSSDETLEKRSLDMRVGSSAGLVAVLASSLATGACSNPESGTKLRPEGPPEIRQLFATDDDGVSKLAYGLHPDIIDADPDDGITPAYSNQAGPVNNAIVTGQRLRIVIDELLEGGTLEQFQCACFRLDGSGCPESSRGFVFAPGTTVDPSRCTTCMDDPVTDTVNETGLCADINFDGIPDDAYLIDSVIQLDCGNGITVTNGPDEGWWNPSGNQLIPVLGGTSALGPAVVFNPVGLPTNSTCTVGFASTVVDKDGNTVTPDPAATGSPSFHTEPMILVVSNPGDGQTGIPIASDISLTFNVSLLATLDAASITVVEQGGGPVAGTAALDPTDDATLVFTPSAPLSTNTTYEVTVLTGAQGVRDSFGAQFPADETFTFTTGAM
jgi:hypothetical protein